MAKELTSMNTAAQHKTLEERLTAFYGKPIEEISTIPGDREFDWGNAEGNEAW